MKRDLLALADLGAAGIRELLGRAEAFAAARDGRGGESASTAAPAHPLAGKTVALVLEKPSTRTRVALEVATVELGGHPLVLGAADSQLGRGEAIEDTARVLGRTVHAVAFRTGARARLDAMARACRAPVLNALSDDAHPMQVLADLFTVRAEHGRLEGLRYAWIGDASNVARSWIEAAGLCGLSLTLACPDGLGPSPAEVGQARRSGADVRVVSDPRDAARGADVIMTDVWVSMGLEAEAAARRQRLAPFRVTRALCAEASPRVMVLHCLPAHRGEEIEAEVLDGPRSFVWETVAARLHTAKAALEWALEPGRRQPPNARDAR